MSRSYLIQALEVALGRPPSEREKAEFLAALAESVGGEYVYVPKLEQSVVDQAEVVRLRIGGMSVRKIARKLGISKSAVGRAIRQPQLSHVSPYEVDKQAA